MNPLLANGSSRSTMKCKDGCNAWMVVPLRAMDGCGVAHSHLLHSAARHLYGLHRERSSHHVSWCGLVAGAAGCGGRPRSGAHDRGRLSRIAAAQYPAAADWWPGGLRQRGERGARRRQQSAMAHGPDRAAVQSHVCPGGRHARSWHVAYAQSSGAALDYPRAPDSQHHLGQCVSRRSESCCPPIPWMAAGWCVEELPALRAGHRHRAWPLGWARSWP